VFINI